MAFRPAVVMLDTQADLRFREGIKEVLPPALEILKSMLRRNRPV